MTERIGALQDDYLARSRPLGASRVPWEIGEGTADVRELRTRLGLDSGYLSRLLRSLEAEELSVTAPGEHDSRVRTVVLTRAGLAEPALLGRDSDALAESLLAPLGVKQREQLVAATKAVERLLTAGLVEIAVEDPTTDAAQHCISQYFAELNQRFDSGFDPTISNSADADELTAPAGLLLIARLHGDPIGCGALKFHTGEPVEIKRMWVDRSSRGLGLGRRLLGELECHALANGAQRARPETNQSIAEAISLYRSAGYEEVPSFNDEPFAHHWFEKAR
ncbi:MAG: GNAT family N-acetyltransferase [Acidimicrobiales bacterium]